MSTDDADAGERVAEHRDALETLADSDLACGWIAERLLETAADDGEQGDER